MSQVFQETIGFLPKYNVHAITRPKETQLDCEQHVSIGSILRRLSVCLSVRLPPYGLCLVSMLLPPYLAGCLRVQMYGNGPVTNTKNTTSRLV